MRTALTPQDFIAETDAWSLGPSKMPWPSTHMNSVPARFTPCNSTGRPCTLTSRFPDTCSRGAASCRWCPCPFGLDCPLAAGLPDEQAGMAHPTAASRHSRMPRLARRGPARFGPMRER